MRRAQVQPVQDCGLGRDLQIYSLTFTPICKLPYGCMVNKCNQSLSLRLKADLDGHRGDPPFHHVTKSAPKWMALLDGHSVRLALGVLIESGLNSMCTE
jgi:hypothetical protein